MLETEFETLTNKEIYQFGFRDGVAATLKSFKNMELFSEEEIDLLINTLTEQCGFLKELREHYDTIEE